MLIYRGVPPGSLCLLVPWASVSQIREVLTTPRGPLFLLCVSYCRGCKNSPWHMSGNAQLAAWVLQRMCREMHGAWQRRQTSWTSSTTAGGRDPEEEMSVPARVEKRCPRAQALLVTSLGGDVGQHTLHPLA